jgi:hypothetical protein
MHGHARRAFESVNDREFVRIRIRSLYSRMHDPLHARVCSRSPLPAQLLLRLNFLNLSLAEIGAPVAPSVGDDTADPGRLCPSAASISPDSLAAAAARIASAAAFASRSSFSLCFSILLASAAAA